MEVKIEKDDPAVLKEQLRQANDALEMRGKQFEALAREIALANVQLQKVPSTFTRASSAQRRGRPWTRSARRCRNGMKTSIKS